MAPAVSTRALSRTSSTATAAHKRRTPARRITSPARRTLPRSRVVARGVVSLPPRPVGVVATARGYTTSSVPKRESADAMSRALACLGDARLHMLSLSATGINLTMVLDEDEVNPLMQRLHKTFFENQS